MLAKSDAAARLHQRRATGADQVPGGDARVPGHPGVDLEDILAQAGDIRGRGRRLVGMR